MANRYWVGGTATWDATAGTKWSTTSGGADGAAVPTAADDVYFDASSGAVTVTTSGTTVDVCRSLDCTGFTGTLNHVASTTITIGDASPGQGNIALKLASGMTYTKGSTSSSALSFVSTSSTQQTLTFAGKTVGNLTFSGVGGNWILQDTLTGASNFSTQISITAGTFDTNNQTISVGSLTTSSTNTKSISLGSSSITLGSTWSIGSSTNLTFNAGTSTITTGNNAVSSTFGGAGLTYNNVNLYSSDHTISGANTFANLTLGNESLDYICKFPSGQTNTITGTLTATSGTSSNRYFVRSTTYGSPATISAATVSINNIDFQDIVGSGAGSWTGTIVGDCLGNSGITFNTPVTRYWVGGTGGWSSTTHWSTSTGGSSGASVPLPQDTAIFDANSFSTTGLTVTLGSSRNGRLSKVLDATAVTNAPTFNFDYTGTTGGSEPTTAYGDFLLASTITVTQTATSGDFIMENRSDANLNLAGVSFPTGITIKSLGATTTLTGDIVASSTKTMTHSYGTLTAGSSNITIGTFNSSGSETRTINMGSGTWTVTSTGVPWTVAVATNLTLNAQTSTILINDTSSTSKTFAGGGKTYNIVTFAGDNILVSAANTFGTMNVNTAGYTTGLKLPSMTTQTVTNFSTNGTAGNLARIVSSGIGSAATLSKSSGTVSEDYMSLQDSTATGGATWYAGSNSVNGSNNSGWIFTAAPVQVDTTKTAQYKTLSKHDTTKGAQYKLLIDNAITKTAQYIVSNDNEVLKNADYLVNAKHGTTKSAQYLVVERSDITKSSQYTVAGLERLDSYTLKALKIGKTFGPLTSLVLGRTPQNDNIVISSVTPNSNAITAVDPGTDLITIVGHGMVDGTLVRILSDGDYPEPLVAGRNYYVYTASSPDTFSLMDSYADAVSGVRAIDILTAGSGTITLEHIATQELQINNNEIVDDDRETLLPPLYQELVGLEWSEVDATTTGLGWHEVGDVVKFVQGSTEVNGLLSEVHLVFDGGLKEVLKSVVPDGSVIDHQTAGGVLKTLYNTEIKVDKQNNDITSIVSEQTSFADTVNTNFTEIYQNLTDIDLTIQKSGGGNLILNSVGFATESTLDDSSVTYDKLSFWDYNPSYDIATNGSVYSYSSSESQNNGGVSGQVIEMAGADVSITQRVNVATGTEISLGLRVKNAVGTGTALITLSNDNDSYAISIDDITDYDWEELSITGFTTTLPWLDITIQVTSAIKFIFTDLRLLYGSSLQGWVQSSSEILSTNVQFTKDGMRIFDSLHDTETRVTYNEFSTRRKSDGAVLFEADDAGIITNDLKIRGVTEYQASGDAVIRQVTIPNGSALAGIAFIKVI